MRKLASQIALLAFVAGGTESALGQGLPTSQPKFLQVVRESVKVGKSAEHSKFEAGWPAAYEKAKSPNYYLALVAMTGPREAWYITPLDSHAAFGQMEKRDDADAVLTAELDRLSAGDAQFLNDSRAFQAIARPDLSHGAYPDLAKMRFWEITTFRVRPGHEAGFAAVAKAYAAAAARSAPKAAWRTYQVVAGMPGPTYMVFESVADFGEFDQGMADGMAMVKSFSVDETIALQKFSAEGLVNSENQRFRLDPVQSYVAKETRQQDPAFWMPKKPPAKAAAQ